MRIAIARETSETKTKILPNIEQLEGSLFFLMI